jgi:hypothetical protein
MLNFKDYSRKKLSHDLNMSRAFALWVSRILTNKNLAKRVKTVKKVNIILKRFHDNIKVVFYIRSSIQRSQYWECKQRLEHVIVYKISKT